MFDNYFEQHGVFIFGNLLNEIKKRDLFQSHLMCIIMVINLYTKSNFTTFFADIKMASNPLADDLISLGDSEDTNSENMAKDSNCYLRDTIMGLHR